MTKKVHIENSEDKESLSKRDGFIEALFKIELFISDVKDEINADKERVLSGAYESQSESYNRLIGIEANLKLCERVRAEVISLYKDTAEPIPPP
jgi:hypothetical protein